MSENNTERELVGDGTQLGELFTRIRLAMDAQRQAGYARGRYIYTAAPTAKDADDMLQAEAKSDELTVQLWRELYDVAPAFTDALQVLEAVKGLEVQA